MKTTLIAILFLLFTGSLFSQEEIELLRIGTADDFDKYLNENSYFKISGPTALFLAAKLNENEKAILFLYDKYLKIDSLNVQHIEDLLFISITKDKKQLFHRILEHPKFDPNIVLGFRDYPIFFALFADNKYYVIKLVDSGADINIVSTNKTKLTPLQHTIATNRFHMFKTIVGNQADIYKNYSGNGSSIVEFLFEKRKNNNAYYKMGLKRYSSPFDDRITDLLLKKYLKEYTFNEKLILLRYYIETDRLSNFKKTINGFTQTEIIRFNMEGKNIYQQAVENPNKKYIETLIKKGLNGVE